MAPLNDVRDEFCSSPDPSPRKKRSSIETPVDEILGKVETEIKETPPIVRTKRASRKVVETTPAPDESTPVTDIDLNKEVAPLVNMPEEKIIPDEMAPIKQDPDMLKKKQQADIRSFFSPPAKEATETKAPFETSPAKSDCSIQLIEERETVKKVLEVDLTESPNKSLNNSLNNSVNNSPMSETKDDAEKQPKQIVKRSPPSITKETLVRHTRGLRLQDRTEVVKQKHQRQREESVGRDKRSVENEQGRSGRSSRQSSALGEPVINGQGLKESRRGRSGNQEKKDGDKGTIELNSKDKQKRDKTADASKLKEKQKGDKTPVESKTNGSNEKRKSTEDDELLKILKEEKNLCLSGRKRVLREANKADGDEEVKVISEMKPTQRRAKRKLSENGITAELEKSSPLPEKKDQEPPFKRQKRTPRDENSSNSNDKVPEPTVPTSTARRAPKEEKENANANKITENGVVEAAAASRKTRKASKEDQPSVNPSNDLNKVPVTAKQNKESDENIKRIDNKELNNKKELTVIESEIPKPTFIEDENGNNDEKAPISNGSIEKDVDEIKPEINGENEATVKLEFNDNKVSPNKLPTYTTMIRSALEEMNVIGGEGCSKLEILLYILRKFRPKGNVNTITTKLIKVLEIGTKKGDFLSSVSCPRVLKKAVEEKKDSKDEDKKKGKEKKQKGKEKEKLKKIKTKDGKIMKVKASKLKKKEKEGKDKEKGKDKTKTKNEKKEKRVVIQSPRKLKEPLSTICKAKKLTRHEVVKKIWAYIHAKKLQDPTDKTVIICDENLKKLTKVKQIQQKSLMGYIKPFMEPIK